MYLALFRDAQNTVTGVCRIVNKICQLRFSFRSSFVPNPEALAVTHQLSLRAERLLSNALLHSCTPVYFYIIDKLHPFILYIFREEYIFTMR